MHETNECSEWDVYCKRADILLVNQMPQKNGLVLPMKSISLNVVLTREVSRCSNGV